MIRGVIHRKIKQIPAFENFKGTDFENFKVVQKKNNFDLMFASGKTKFKDIFSF